MVVCLLPKQNTRVQSPYPAPTQNSTTLNKNSPNLFFLKESLKKFKTQGAFFPSSVYLSEKMLKPIIFKDDVFIIELGAGTGVLTKKLIAKLPKDGKLLVFEINPLQAEFLKKNITDERMIIIEEDAAKMSDYLRKNGLSKADYILSGLPLGNFSKKVVKKILLEIKENLKDDGCYIQFQYLLADWLNIKKLFDIKIIGYEIRNIPPAFVYLCKKKID